MNWIWKKIYLYSSLYHSFLQVNQHRWFLNKPNRKRKYLHRVATPRLFHAGAKGAKWQALTWGFSCRREGTEVQGKRVGPFQSCGPWKGTGKLQLYFYNRMSLVCARIRGSFQNPAFKTKVVCTYTSCICGFFFKVSSNFHIGEKKNPLLIKNEEVIIWRVQRF